MGIIIRFIKNIQIMNTKLFFLLLTILIIATLYVASKSSESSVLLEEEEFDADLFLNYIQKKSKKEEKKQVCVIHEIRNTKTGDSYCDTYKGRKFSQWCGDRHVKKCH